MLFFRGKFFGERKSSPKADSASASGSLTPFANDQNGFFPRAIVATKEKNAVFFFTPLENFRTFFRSAALLLEIPLKKGKLRQFVFKLFSLRPKEKTCNFTPSKGRSFSPGRLSSTLQKESYFRTKNLFPAINLEGFPSGGKLIISSLIGKRQKYALSWWSPRS